MAFFPGTISEAFGQEQVKLDTTDILGTPFKKKVWLTGIAGSFSSGSALTDTTTQRVFSNSFGIDLSTGRFVRDRWLVGLLFQTSKESSRQFIIRESEDLFIGPLIQHYLIDDEIGSIFLSFSPGYASLRESTQVERNGIIQREKARGDGFAMVMSAGYSYVMHRRIAFDIRMNISNAWITAERTSEPSGVRTNQSVQVGNISFSFGFNVLLDSFFF